MKTREEIVEIVKEEIEKMESNLQTYYQNSLKHLNKEIHPELTENNTELSGKIATFKNKALENKDFEQATLLIIWKDLFVEISTFLSKILSDLPQEYLEDETTKELFNKIKGSMKEITKQLNPTKSESDIKSVEEGKIESSEDPTSDMKQPEQLPNPVEPNSVEGKIESSEGPTSDMKQPEPLPNPVEPNPVEENETIPTVNMKRKREKDRKEEEKKRQKELEDMQKRGRNVMKKLRKKRTASVPNRETNNITTPGSGSDSDTAATSTTPFTSGPLPNQTEMNPQDYFTLFANDERASENENLIAEETNEIKTNEENQSSSGSISSSISSSPEEFTKGFPPGPESDMNLPDYSDNSDSESSDSESDNAAKEPEKSAVVDLIEEAPVDPFIAGRNAANPQPLSEKQNEEEINKKIDDLITILNKKHNLHMDQLVLDDNKKKPKPPEEAQLNSIAIENMRYKDHFNRDQFSNNPHAGIISPPPKLPMEETTGLGGTLTKNRSPREIGLVKLINITKQVIDNPAEVFKKYDKEQKTLRNFTADEMTNIKAEQILEEQQKLNAIEICKKEIIRLEKFHTDLVAKNKIAAFSALKTALEESQGNTDLTAKDIIRDAEKKVVCIPQTHTNQDIPMGTLSQARFMTDAERNSKTPRYFAITYSKKPEGPKDYETFKQIIETRRGVWLPSLFNGTITSISTFNKLKSMDTAETILAQANWGIQKQDDQQPAPNILGNLTVESILLEEDKSSDKTSEEEEIHTYGKKRR